MANRVMRGEINGSESLSRVSLQADLTFRALILAVDDFGRIDARPAILKAALFPVRDDVTPEILMGWLEELCDEGCVLRYQVGNRWYLQLTGWEDHRGNTKRAKCSRLPPPRGHESSSEEEEIGVGGGVGEDRSTAPHLGDPGDPGDPGTDDPLEGYDPQKLVSLLSPESRDDRHDKLGWLISELPSIVAAARAGLADKGVEDPTRKQMTAKVKDRLQAFWKFQEGEGKSRRQSPAQARIERGKQAAANVLRELEGQ